MNSPAKADFSLNLTWQGGQQFQGVSGDVTMTLDGRRKAGASPVQALAFALAGCMGIDVVDMIEKGRLPLKSLSCELQAFRAAEPPRSITGIDLHFLVKGDVPEDRVGRAIELSREKYCSVWHSMNQGIEFKTSFTVTA